MIASEVWYLYYAGKRVVTKYYSLYLRNRKKYTTFVG